MPHGTPITLLIASLSHLGTHLLPSPRSTRHCCFSPPPSPFQVVKDPVAQTSRILVEPHLIDAEFRKAWMPFFCRSGHPVVTVDQFLSFVGPFLPQEAELDLHRMTGQDLLEIGLRSLQLEGWMVGP